MNLEEYKKKIKAIDEAYKKDKDSAAYQYAMSNNPVSIGDIVSDGIDTIKVERITVTFMASGFPACRYYGHCITKKGNPYKDGRTGIVTQSMLKTINGKKYEAAK